MDKLPVYRTDAPRPKPQSRIFKSLLTAVLLAVGLLVWVGSTADSQEKISSKVPINAAEIVQHCQLLDVQPGPPQDFHHRSHSDRFVPGTPPTLIKNATIWTGRESGNEVVNGDLLLDRGLIKAIGSVNDTSLLNYHNLVTIDVGGAWVTPGIVDIHSHLGVDSAPALRGAADTNSYKGLVLPWLRSLDGLNTHDEAYKLTVSGGVTTANVLPGSADAIGGQAFTIKLRPTSERSSSAMVLEPPYSLNGTHVDPSLPPRWRQMKHACGENPSRVYSGTRMDTIWAFRQGYDAARQIKQKQDKYCAKALAGEWDGLGAFPESLQWEALVDVLRGRVKVHNHCYEAVDLDGMVRLTNEFKFSIAAFHHAHETYLVPDLLKKAYGTTPAVALFATNARYKREAYRGSEFAPRILTNNDLRVVMKSDHPVLNSRFLLNEAQQAHYYGLPTNLALASVTSTPAAVLGYDHRIGSIKLGYDADIVVWDSHPLALGATPKQVYIDGVAQLKAPYVGEKPAYYQQAPKTPDFDREAEEAVKYDGLPPLSPKKVKTVVIFNNVGSLYVKQDYSVKEIFASNEVGKLGVVVVDNGRITCSGLSPVACPLAQYDSAYLKEEIDLEGGSISPALVSFGSHLGLNHIDGEASTNDGNVIDPLKSQVPDILGQGSIIRAVDGLQFSTRDALLAYRSGATTGVTAPSSHGFLAGLSTAFNTGLPHKLVEGAVLQDVAALHVAVGFSGPSVSTQIAALRSLLLGQGVGELASYFKDVVKGRLPLVVKVESADIIATLVGLKKEVEAQNGVTIQMTLVGANEAHLLARELGEAGVGVIVSSRPFPGSWKSRRILPGPPLSEDSAATLLLRNNVTVGIAVEEQWASRNIRFDIGWTALEADGKLSTSDAIALASVNLEQLLGIKTPNTDLVAVKHGSLLEFEGKVAAIISPLRGLVDLIL